MKRPSARIGFGFDAIHRNVYDSAGHSDTGSPDKPAERKLSHSPENSDADPTTLSIGVIGTGLMGASLVDHISTNGPKADFVVHDTDDGRSALVAARQTNVHAVDSLAGMADCDFVFVCTPVSTIAAYIVQLAAIVGPHAVIVDTGSTKAKIVAEVLADLPDFSRFVPGHPMSGSHEVGPAKASAKIFTQRPFVLTPYTQTDPQAVEKTQSLLEQSGSEVLITPVDEHDCVLGATSHLAHLTAFALVNQLNDDICPDHLHELIAGSFMRMTLFAASDPKMWSDVFLANTDNVLTGLNRLRARMDEMEAAILAKDEAKLLALIGSANLKRKSMETPK